MYPHHHLRGPPSPPGSVAGSLASSVGPAPHRHHHHQQRAFSHQHSHQPHPYQPHLQQFHPHARPHPLPPPPPPPPSSRPHSSPQQQQHHHQHQRDAVPHAVLPILGTTQSGKSTLVQFLHDYCGMRPNDPSALQIGNGVNSMTKTSRCYSLRVPRRTALLVPVPDPVSPQLGHSSPMGSGISSIPSLASRTPSISSSTSTAPPHAQLAANAISPMGAALDPAEDAYLSNLLQSAHAVLDDDKDPWSIDESEIPPSSPAMSWFDPHEHGLPSPRPTPSPTPPSMQGPPSIRSGYNGMVPTAPMSNMMVPPPPPPPPQVRQVALHPPSEPRTLYQLLSDLHDATFAGFTNAAPTRAQRAEYLERVEDLLHARTLRLDVTPIPHQAAPRMLLDVIDTPGLLDQASFHDPMVDLDHLVGLLDTVRRTGHAVTALVYVIGGDRPYDAAALRALATYLHNARDLSPHLIVVHSNYQVHRALARAKTRVRPSPADQADDDDVPAFCLFDLGPRVAEFNRLLANLGFPDVHAVHVAMDNLPAGPLQRAGLQAVCYEGMHAFLDVVEQLASRAPPATPVARVHLVKPSILKELDAAFVGPAAQQRVELARHAVAALQRGPADLERKLVAAAERVAEVRAELAKVDAELARLDVDDVVDIATRVAVPVAECTCHGVRASSMSLAEWVRDQQRRAAAHAAGGSARHAPGCPAGAPSTSSRPSRSSSSRRHAASAAAASRVVLDLESAVAIRDVHVVATSPRARLLDAQITRDKRRYRLVGTVPPDGAIVAKFFATRRDVYASVIAALKGARGALAARLARAQKRLETVLVAVGHDRRRVADAEGALARAWRVASAVGADRVPLDTYMGVHDEYRALAAAAMAKAGAGQQQQGYHGTDPDAVAARIVDRMLHGMLVADLAAGNLGGVEEGVPAP